MKFAISTDGEYVSAHFGRCPSFTIVEIDNGRLVNKMTIDNPGHHPGFLPRFLQQQGVNAIVAGGMGQRAQDLFVQAGIRTVVGIRGKIDEIMKEAAAGTLKGGESLCKPGAGKGYGVEKDECDHSHEE
ncbi:MAG: NifB/NifX family molybdenum-iron cluster-binding protein [Candidatus Omnitrophica bacterium]|nr:NifB/NifX family molybdenum-iron cluster-binding protein [Candidatus Omnitrophota bacterium]